MFCLISLACIYNIGLMMSISSVRFTLWRVYQPVSSKYFKRISLELNGKTADQVTVTRGINSHSIKI